MGVRLHALWNCLLLDPMNDSAGVGLLVITMPAFSLTTGWRSIFRGHGRRIGQEHVPACRVGGWCRGWLGGRGSGQTALVAPVAHPAKPAITGSGAREELPPPTPMLQQGALGSFVGSRMKRKELDTWALSEGKGSLGLCLHPALASSLAPFP